MLHDLACNQFRFTSPILLQMGVFLCSSADDISYTIKKSVPLKVKHSPFHAKYAFSPYIHLLEYMPLLIQTFLFSYRGRKYAILLAARLLAYILPLRISSHPPLFVQSRPAYTLLELFHEKKRTNPRSPKQSIRRPAANLYKPLCISAPAAQFFGGLAVFEPLHHGLCPW